MKSTKVCVKCDEVLPATVEFFHWRKDTKSLTGTCKMCHQMMAMFYRRKNKASIKKTRDKWVSSEKGTALRYLSRLRVFYKVDETALQDMMNEQRGCCAICHKSLGSYHIDHNHETGEVRGLLCCMCNHMLGQSKDNPNTLMRGATYLLSRGHEDTH